MPKQRCESSHLRLLLRLGVAKVCLSVGVHLGVGSYAETNPRTWNVDFLVRLGVGSYA